MKYIRVTVFWLLLPLSLPVGIFVSVLYLADRTTSFDDVICAFKHFYLGSED